MFLLFPIDIVLFIEILILSGPTVQRIHFSPITVTGVVTTVYKIILLFISRCLTVYVNYIQHHINLSIYLWICFLFSLTQCFN